MGQAARLTRLSDLQDRKIPSVVAEIHDCILEIRDGYPVRATGDPCNHQGRGQGLGVRVDDPHRGLAHVPTIDVEDRAQYVDGAG